MSSHTPEVRFQLICEQSELFAIADDWRRLLAQSANTEPMLDPSWMLGWWRQYGAGVQLAVGVLFDGDLLVGIAPLCIRKFHYCPGLAFRRLQFMAVDADEKDGICSMNMNFIALSGYETVVSHAFVDRISAGAFGVFDEVMIGPMRSELAISGLAQRRLEQSALRCEEKRRTINYYVKLPSTWDEYLGAMSMPRRTYIKNALVEFEEWASVSGGWKLHSAIALDALDNGFTTLIGLQPERSSPRFIAFQRDYMTNRGASGTLEIAWLSLGTVAVAAMYTIRNGKNVLAYHYGAATRMPSKMNAGIVINALLIQQAIARGDEVFDFLSGGFGYEADFATDERPVFSLRAARPCWREAVRLVLINARDRTRAAVKTGRSLLGKSPQTALRTPAQH